VAAIAAGFTLSACGGQARQDANEPSGTFHVAVTGATFPVSQRLAQHSHLKIAIVNTGHKTIPDVAVTITDPKHGTSLAAFGQQLSMSGLASHSRPIWIVDRGPGPCQYSCREGGPGGAVTAYSNTWAMGALRPGATATFDWAVTAVSPGTHEIEYIVAAGLNGKAKARLSNGSIPKGTFTVTVSRQPQQSYVNGSGQVVNTK
jgi:hypothetical protein